MTTPDYSAYPAAEGRLYGVPTWFAGPMDDSPSTVLAAGHDDAALIAYGMAMADGLLRYYGLDSSVLETPIERAWVIFRTECGCADAQHAGHDDCEDDCVHYGLPPCRDDYGWVTETVTPDTPGALPVVRTQRGGPR